MHAYGDNSVIIIIGKLYDLESIVLGFLQLSLLLQQVYTDM